MTELDFTVIGTPAPAGSKRAFVVNGRARMTESSKGLRPWWQAVAGAAQEALPEGWEPLGGSVLVEVTFFVKRPRSHYGTGKNANRLKLDAPHWCDKKPDSDKLERSVLDALTAVGAWRDDSQVARLVGEKVYADPANNGVTGARIFVAPLNVAPAGVAPGPSVGATPSEQGVLL